VVFANFTLQDCAAARVEAHARLLVEACGKLLRKRTIKNNIGWTRTIETKSAAKPNEHLENTHAHLILVFPPELRREVQRLDWESLWSDCAGAEARSAVVKIARAPQAVARYLTKSQAKDFVKDARVGIANPLRYWLRVQNGHAKFSGGGMLKLKVYFNASDQTGLSKLFPRSTQRTAARKGWKPWGPPIEVEVVE
jgi:hypothetical protein